MNSKTNKSLLEQQQSQQWQQFCRPAVLRRNNKSNIEWPGKKCFGFRRQSKLTDHLQSDNVMTLKCLATLIEITHNSAGFLFNSLRMQIECSVNEHCSHAIFMWQRKLFLFGHCIQVHSKNIFKSIQQSHAIVNVWNVSSQRATCDRAKERYRGIS